MSKRQFGLAAIAILLLSPSLVSATESIDAINLTVGKIQITTTDRGTSINTPHLQLAPPTATDNRLLSRRQRSRIQVRRKQTTAPAIVRPRIDADDSDSSVVSWPSPRNPTIPSVPKVPSVPSVTTSTVHKNPTVRSSTIRTTNEDNDSLSASEQHQSVQCSGGGTVSQSSSSTINGRTVKSEVSSKCY